MYTVYRVCIIEISKSNNKHEKVKRCRRGGVEGLKGGRVEAWRVDGQKFRG